MFQVAVAPANKTPANKTLRKHPNRTLWRSSYMELSQQNLEEALGLLGNLLATQMEAGVWLVLCGGSALLAHAHLISTFQG